MASIEGGNKHLIHIVIPHYRAPEFLERLLDSIATAYSQAREWCTCKVWVVNDSPEVSLAALEQRPHPFEIVWMKQEQNSGVAEARNVPLDHIHSGYITWIDQDDTLNAHYFTQIAPALSPQKVLLINASMDFEKTSQPLFNVPPVLKRSVLSWYNPIRTPGMLVFPVAFIREGGWRFFSGGKHGGSDDWAFHFQWMEKQEVTYLPEALLTIHRGAHNASRNVRTAYWSRWTNTQELIRRGLAPIALHANWAFRALFAPFFLVSLPGQSALYGMISGMERIADQNFWFYLRKRYLQKP